MKEEAVLAFDQAVVEAKGVLYDTGFADGVASVPPCPVIVDGVDMGLPAAEELAALIAAVDAVKGELQPQIDQLKLDLAGSVDALAQMTALELAVEAKLNKIRELLA